MEENMTIKQIIAEAKTLVDLNDGDYKDYAANLFCSVLSVVESNGLEWSVLGDMPDGCNCPRAFSEWVNTNC